MKDAKIFFHNLRQEEKNFIDFSEQCLKEITFFFPYVKDLKAMI